MSLPPQQRLSSDSEWLVCRLVEQQFGNYQVFEDVQQAKKDRHRFGRFFFRFPKGESGQSAVSSLLGVINIGFGAVLGAVMVMLVLHLVSIVVGAVLGGAVVVSTHCVVYVTLCFAAF